MPTQNRPPSAGRNHNSYLLAQWDRFNQPQLLVPSEQADEINIYGPITTQDSADFWKFFYDTDYQTGDVEFQQALARSTSQTVRLIINSPGGDVWAGSAIRSFIQSEQAKGRSFEAHIVGVAASAAAFIAVAANHITIADMGMFMIHRAAVGYDAWGYGNEDDLQVAINDFESRKQSLREINKAQVKIFAERTGKTVEAVRELLRKETWFNAESAVEEKFCDAVQPAGAEPASFTEKTLPQGFNLTPSGGIAHERPAYLFAAAAGLQRLTSLPPQEKKPSAPPINEGVSRMAYHNEISALLGLPEGTIPTEAQTQQAVGLLLTKNKDLEAKLAKVEKESLLDKAKIKMQAHVDRGAITPHQKTSILSTIMAAADPEEQLALQDSIFSDLPDGDNAKTPGQTARTPQGTGRAPEVEASTERKLAYEFKAKMEEYKKEGLGVAAQQDRAIAELSDAHLEAYMHFDFDNDKGSEED